MEREDLTCPGVGPESQLDPLLWGDRRKFALCGFSVIPSTYSLSAAFFAAPRFWEFGSEHDLSNAKIQSLASVQHTSLKALLYEGIVFHRFQVGERTMDLRPPREPVGFVDGHAAAMNFAHATPGVPIGSGLSGVYPMRQTEHGVLGIDYRSTR